MVWKSDPEKWLTRLSDITIISNGDLPEDEPVNNEPMGRQENIIRMNYEIAMGYKWGDRDSLIEQTEENKAKWDRMAFRAELAARRGWVIEIPSDLPDISDLEYDPRYDFNVETDHKDEQTQ